MPEPQVLEFSTREEWLAARRNFITASDVAAILGFDPKRTAAHVWLEKRGSLEPEPDDPSKKAGRRLERLVVDWYAEENSDYTVTAHQHRLEVHPEIPWAAVSPDATAIDSFKDKRNVEAKTGNNFNKDPEQRYGEAGTDAVPRRNIVQAQMQMFVRGMDITDQPVLIGGFDFRVFHIPRSEEFIHVMVAKLVQFRELVIKGIPPAVDYDHASALDLVQQMHRDVEAKTIEIDPEHLQLAKDLQQARDYAKQIAKFENTVKAKILGLMGDYEYAKVKGTDVELRRHAIKKNFQAKPASTRTEIHLKVKGLPDGNEDSSTAGEARIDTTATAGAIEG